MPGPYDQDLRELALSLLCEGLTSQQVGERLKVDPSAVRRWRRRAELEGSPRAHQSPGRPRKLRTVDCTLLLALVHSFPGLTARELAAFLPSLDPLAPSVSPDTLERSLRRSGYTHKKLHRIAAERDPAACAAFEQQLAELHLLPHQCIYVDETAKDERNLWRQTGWALKGTPAYSTQPFARGIKLSLVAALGFNGMLSARAIAGAFNALTFLQFILEDVLPHCAPFPDPNSVIILDNCSIHRSHTLRELVEGAGCKLIFLPPYSPSFSAIEGAFAQIKLDLSLNGEYYRTLDPLDGILEAAGQIGPLQAQGLYRYAGWNV